MQFGAITNSWKHQLDSQELPALVHEARARGARHIELRQTCLGACESGSGEDWRPVFSQLESLVQQFPDLTFDLAMAWPCLTTQAVPQGEPFQAALRGAKLVGGSTPHLRLVDPAPFDAAWEQAGDIPAEALSVAELAREAARQGVILSMENSGQPIRSMALLVREARARLTPEEGRYLGLCPDPTNQLRRYPESDPLAELESLPLDMLKIVHFKQARLGRAHPTVDTGDMDCARMLQILARKGFTGPAVMEIPPDAQVFDNLTASFAFLEAVAGEK
ncbi:MAG: sugar phosphate isomerase/epimerase family protein [Candidatus Tectimicrobiota bacterium]